MLLADKLNLTTMKHLLYDMTGGDRRLLQRHLLAPYDINEKNQPPNSSLANEDIDFADEVISLVNCKTDKEI